MDDILSEVQRQRDLWGAANAALPDDRWLEIALDEWNDLRWAVRSRAESPGHTIAKERVQLIAVLLRWHEQAS